MNLGTIMVFLFCIINISDVHATRPVTNEDIRDAILSIVHMIRSNDDKLQRHEFREKTLGDQLKKALSTIDKRQRLLDPVKGTLGRLDERLATVETILMQKDERERIQMQKIFDMVDQIHRSLPQLFEALKNDIAASFPKDEAKPQTIPPNVPSKTDLEKLQKDIENKIDDVTVNTVRNLDGKLTQIWEENKNNNKINQHATENLETIKQHLNSSHEILQKYEEKLAAYNDNVRTTAILQALDKQNVDANKIQKDIVTKINVSNNAIHAIEGQLLKLQEQNANAHNVKEHVTENLEDLKRNLHNNQLIMEEYASTLKEYTKKIDVLAPTYKTQNDLQTQTMLQAIEAQNKNVKKQQKEIENKIDITSKIIKTMDANLSKLNVTDALKKYDQQSQLIQNIQNTQRQIESKIDSANNALRSVENGLANDAKTKQKVAENVDVLRTNLTNAQAILAQKIQTLQNDNEQQTKIIQAVQNYLPGLQNEIRIGNNDLHAKNEQQTKDLVQALDNLEGTLQNQIKNLNNDNSLQERVAVNVDLIKKNLDNILPQYKAENDQQTTAILQAQNANAKQILSEIQNMPKSQILEEAQNSTLRSLEEIKYEMIHQASGITTRLDTKLKEIESKDNLNHEQVRKSLGILEALTENINGNIAVNFERLRTKMEALNKLEQAMVQTADSATDAKRRIEYGVQQILVEVGDLVKDHTKEVNAAVKEKLVDLESSLLDSKQGALANLTSKISGEIDQVWRQIGIMHQELSANKDLLTNIQNQTDNYVNTSANTMANMKGKVGQITSSMIEVEDNLNYLLGRLLLVTQEFNQIRTGLGDALDEIKHSFHVVQQKVRGEDAGPGPHQIPAKHIEPQT